MLNHLPGVNIFIMYYNQHFKMKLNAIVKDSVHISQNRVNFLVMRSCHLSHEIDVI